VSSYSYFLPKPSFNFFKDEFEEYLAEELEPVTSYSRARLAEVIYLRLFGSSITPSLFPLSQLSEIGQSFQRLITNLALFNADPANFGKRGHGLHSVEHASQFALTGVFAGSVQLRIESIQPHDLLPELNPAYQGIKSFTELSQQQDVQQVCQLLGTYPPRLCSSFLAYITAIQKTNAGISLRWGSPQLSDEWHVRWTPERVSEVASEVSRLTISNESVFEATGFFIEGSMTSGRFTFLDTSTARRFRGVLAPEIEQSVVALSKESKIAVLYDVVVRETISTTPANAASCDYTFLEVREAGKKE
jgi:hypothetical protein